MRKDLTDITVVLDRSGSMKDIQQDAEGGLNAFVEEQKKQPGEALFTLVQFDTEYDFVHRGIPVKDVPKLKIQPRGYTALRDAVGRAIAETGERLSAMPEADRPGLVVFVIVTDGEENSSKEFSPERVNEMVSHQESKYAWKFIFLGADQDAFKAGIGLGISQAGIANYNSRKYGCAVMYASANVTRMRGASLKGVDACDIRPDFSAAERKDMASA